MMKRDIRIEFLFGSTTGTEKGTVFSTFYGMNFYIRPKLRLLLYIMAST